MKNPIFVKMFMFSNKNAMKAEELEKIQEEIENKIFAWANDCGLASDDLDAISDGVADCAAYLNSSPRVAWILKEPYDDKDETTGSYFGGGWSLSKLLRDSTTFDNKTWQGIIYVMYGLTHNLYYDEMDYVRNNPEMGNAIKSVAIINLSKMPAGTTSGDRAYVSGYQKYWRPTVKSQVDAYDPEVIVFGNTFGDCWQDFVSPNEKAIASVRDDNGRCFINVYKQGARLLLDAYHPGIRNNKGFYVDSLIDTIQKYR